MRKFLTAFLILCAISPLLSACGLVDAIISLGYTPTPTITLTPTVTMTPSSTPTATASATPTETLTPTATPTDTATPTETPTSTPTPTETPTPTPTSTDTPVPSPTWDAETLVGAGDIAICGLDTDDKTADLLARIPGQIFIAGDVSNEQGTYEQFANCFSQSWGRFLERIHPVPGNHDYQTLGASGYYDYFGAIAGDRYKGYYSYNVGAWHIVALNSMCSNVGGCTADAPQAQWLKQDLADNPAKCTLAYMHHPRFSSGQAGNINWVDAYYRILYDAGADVLIGGHEHDYERFAPQDPLGNLDVERGIRQFVVGTGGAYSIGFYDIKANSEVRNTGDFGVIKFSLFADKYAWEFISAEGSDFSDFGVDSCH